MDQSTRGVTVYSEYSLPFFIFYFLFLKNDRNEERGNF